MKRDTTTVRVFYQHRLAKAGKRRLYRALEAFANVGDSAKEYQQFGVDWPSFYPAPIPQLQEEVTFTEQGRQETYRWIPEAAELFHAYRRLLRGIWKGDPTSRKYVGVLLGTDHTFLKKAEEGETGHGEPDDSFCAGWHELKTVYTDAECALSFLFPSWPTGEFRYNWLNDFQSALYCLFRESWRAKICSQCDRHFIAGKPAQMYCNVGCTGEIKRRRNLEWWRREGDKQRQKKLKRPVARR